MVSELIPAGFEIENPRLNPDRQFTFELRNPMPVDHLDIRDDRLLIFTGTERNSETEFYYLIRVVNKGEFTIPPLSAEALYDRGIRSVNGSAKAVVK